MQDAYIVAAMRTPVGKAGGAFAQTRPDDLLAQVLTQLLSQHPTLDPKAIDDVIIGCAMPEAEQGMNVARVSALLAGLPQSVAGVTVNRFCASGLQSIAMAADRIRLGDCEVMIAGGVESMSLVPMAGNKPSFSPAIFQDNHLAMAFGMGITAEKVAQQWQVSREAQDAFALQSHQRALAAQQQTLFDAEICPITIDQRRLDAAQHQVRRASCVIQADQGPRTDTSLEALAKLRPVFSAEGSVTAGNSSQMSDGAAALLLCSEAALKQHNLTPMARFVGFSVVGVAPEIMGIGPIHAIPKVLKQTGVSLKEIDRIELNEAFAAQSLAVINTLSLPEDKVNPLGGAIALGHPLGATGSIRTATLLHGLKREQLGYGLVTMCIGNGMGAAGLFETV